MSLDLRSSPVPTAVRHVYFEWPPAPVPTLWVPESARPGSKLDGFRLELTPDVDPYAYDARRYARDVRRWWIEPDPKPFAGVRDRIRGER